jgi:hypothetical protein
MVTMNRKTESVTGSCATDTALEAGGKRPEAECTQQLKIYSEETYQAVRTCNVTVQFSWCCEAGKRLLES